MSDSNALEYLRSELVVQGKYNLRDPLDGYKEISDILDSDLILRKSRIECSYNHSNQAEHS